MFNKGLESCVEKRINQYWLCPFSKDCFCWRHNSKTPVLLISFPGNSIHRLLQQQLHIFPGTKWFRVESRFFPLQITSENSWQTASWFVLFMQGVLIYQYRKRTHVLCWPVWIQFLCPSPVHFVIQLMTYFYPAITKKIHTHKRQIWENVALFLFLIAVCEIVCDIICDHLQYSLWYRREL